MKTRILDTTVRDGSYAVDFKFSCHDIQDIISRLVKLNVEYIEIGHGMGLNASSPDHGIQLFSDVEYMDSAKRVSGKSKLGVFCIPGIARLSDLSVAKEHGMSFVRIGVPVEEFESAKEYISFSKKIGLEVMVNFMKSYASTPEAFANATASAYEQGADCVYLVDSAGCMLPEDIDEFYKAVKQKNPDIRLGFHGHNNMGMAVANSLRCVELGFNFVDCSFQGLGRSIGNTPLEMFVMALMKRYGENSVNMDLPRLLEYGYSILKSIISDRDLYNPLDLICGYTGFHSSFLRDIYRCCCETEVDPLRLIMAYSKISKVNMDYGQLKMAAKDLPRDEVDDHPYNFRKFFSNQF